MIPVAQEFQGVHLKLLDNTFESSSFDRVEVVNVQREKQSNSKLQSFGLPKRIYDKNTIKVKIISKNESIMGEGTFELPENFEKAGSISIEATFDRLFSVCKMPVPKVNKMPNSFVNK